jgi:hypothetical protein
MLDCSISSLLLGSMITANSQCFRHGLLLELDDNCQIFSILDTEMTVQHALFNAILDH